jgi:hypothetical protein
MPTISVRRYDYETLKTKLKPGDRVAIVSCDSCAKQCDGLGGEQGLKSLADKLAADGFPVVYQELVRVACSAELVSASLADGGRQALEDADAVIHLPCCAGVEQARQVLPGLKILEVTRTLGKGTYSAETGARLTAPLEEIGIQVDGADGITLSEAAERLGLQSGSF